MYKKWDDDKIFLAEFKWRKYTKDARSYFGLSAVNFKTYFSLKSIQKIDAWRNGSSVVTYKQSSTAVHLEWTLTRSKNWTNELN